MKDLVVKVDNGEILENNFEEFKKYVLAEIEKSNRDIITAQDLTEARNTIKDCELVEITVHNAIKAIEHPEEIERLLKSFADLAETVRGLRLSIKKKADAKVESDKQRIIDDGYTQVKTVWKRSSANHGIAINRSDFSNAIKGKSSTVKMEEAVSELVEKLLNDISELEEVYKSNLALISESEKEFPGLYPDRKTICLEDSVENIIEMRVAKFRLAAKEKAEREAEHTKLRLVAKEEGEKKRAAEQKEREERLLDNRAKEPVENTIFENPPDFHVPTIHNDISVALTEIVVSFEIASLVATAIINGEIPHIKVIGD